MIAPMRPDRYLKMIAAMRREGMGMTAGFAGAPQRCPDRLALIDELGTLTWRQLDERINALAAALQQRCPPGDRKWSASCAATTVDSSKRWWPPTGLAPTSCC